VTHEQTTCYHLRLVFCSAEFCNVLIVPPVLHLYVSKSDSRQGKWQQIDSPDNMVVALLESVLRLRLVVRTETSLCFFVNLSILLVSASTT